MVNGLSTMEDTWWCIAVILVANFSTSSTQQDSVFAIPMLFTYNDCNATSTSLDYTLYFLHNEGGIASYTAFTTSGPNSPQIVFGQTFNHTWNWCFFDLEDDLRTPDYQCNNSVFGLYVFFQEHPTISMIATLWSEDFAQAFSILPQPSYLELGDPINGTADLYHYYILFGHHADKNIMGGIAISVVADETNITLEFETDIDFVVLRNAQETNNSNGSQSEWTVNDLRLFEVFWIQPEIYSCNNTTTGSLRGTKITSTKPLSVFTTKLKCSATKEFSYDSQVVHQMPSVGQWGKEFVVDIQQLNILPDREDISYNLHIRAAGSSGNITITYLQNNTHSDIVYHSIEAEEELIETLTPVTYTHVHIEATEPVLILLDIHSLPVISYSVMVQPVEWFSNQQMIVLPHPRPNIHYRYHISAVVPEKYFNTDKILVVQDVNKTSELTAISRYEGFNGKVLHAGDYDLFYIEMDSSTLNRSENGTILVMKHANPCGKLGVTVYTYADDLQYAYSNGYIRDSGPRIGDISCVTTVDDTDTADDRVDVRAAITVAVSIFLLVIITATTSVILCVCRRYKRSASEPSIDYKFDVFLSFADEDQKFVDKNIRIPLEQQGYQVFWHYKHFQPGRTIMENIERAVNISRRTVFICSRHFAESQFCMQEMTYCLDMQRKQKLRKVVPVVLEEEHCPKELRHFNQIRIRREDMDDREVGEVIMKMNLGEQVKGLKHEGTMVESEV